MGLIAERYLEALKEEAREGPQHVNRASEIGHPCERYLVYRRLRWQEAAPIPPQKLLIFREAQRHEVALIKDLQEAGLRITKQQMPFYNKDLQLTGHVDGFIELDGEKFPLEIKAVNPYHFAHISDHRTLLALPAWWLRMWWWQLQAYLLLTGSQKLILVLKNRLTGEIKDMEVEPRPDAQEHLRIKCMVINDHVRREDLPRPPDDLDEEVCRDCPFAHLCLPDVVRTPRTVVWDETEVLGLLEMREELYEAHKRWEEVDKQLKDIFREVKVAVVGDYVITGKWVERKAYQVPPGRYWKMRIRKVTKRKEG